MTWINFNSMVGCSRGGDVRTLEEQKRKGLIFWKEEGDLELRLKFIVNFTPLYEALELSSVVLSVFSFRLIK